jgi:hypothetical protein
MNKKYIGFGVRPSDKDFFKITKTQYEPNPEQKIGNYDLVLNTPTIKAYLDAPSKTIMLSIRGTTDSRDVMADTMIPFNRLKYSNRYTEDKNIISNLVMQYPPNDYDYYATGHSLGVALMRQLQREFPFIKNTVGFNGAVQPYDIIDQKASLNKSYYTEDDALYKLGGKLLTNKTVLPSTVHTLKVPGVVPMPAPVKVGQFVYNASQGHKLDNFEGVLGGAISRMRERLLKMTVKEIKEAVKNELNGLIKGYSRMKKEDLIDAIRNYQKQKKKQVEPIKSEEPKKKETPTKKLSKKEEFEKKERKINLHYIITEIIENLKKITNAKKYIRMNFKKIKVCDDWYHRYKLEKNKDELEEENKKIKLEYGTECMHRKLSDYLLGYIYMNWEIPVSSIEDLLSEDALKYRNLYYIGWREEKYPEDFKTLSKAYKDRITKNFIKLNDDELKHIKRLLKARDYEMINIDEEYKNIEILKEKIKEAAKKKVEPIKGGSRCICHIKHIIRGGAIEERKFNSFDDFKTTELRKIASIFNKFFKIKLTKLSRDEILNELEKYLILAENGSIYVNEDNFFSLKPKAMIKEIEAVKLINKLKREAKPKTRRDILMKEKIGDLKSLLISLGGDPTYKLNGRITQLPKRSVIDEILVQELKKKKMKI